MSVQTFEESTLQLPRLMPSATVTNHTGPGEDAPHAALTLRVLVSRDALAYALDCQVGGEETHPDTWPVEFIRESVERELALNGAFHLTNDSHLIVAALDDPEVADRVRAEYRAIDRAYPGMPGSTVITGWAFGKAHCTVCPWSVEGAIEAITDGAVEHAALHP